MKICMTTYSYVAEPVGYQTPIDWDRVAAGARSVPPAAFVSRLLDRLAPAGLDGVELWFGNVPPDRVDDALAAELRGMTEEAGLEVAGISGSPGDPGRDVAEVERRLAAAAALGAGVIVGSIDRSVASSIRPFAERFGVVVAHENHTEANAAEILEVVGSPSEWVGVGLDTGSIAQHGGDPVAAVDALGPRIVHVHLRDCQAVGSDASVPLGTGIVDVDAVIGALGRIGYDRWLSLEVPLEDRDPTQAIIDGVARVRAAVAATVAIP
jgi:sugar phosphate isomerase/epimerase